MVEKHFAWFRRADKGEWLGEWRGSVPEPDIPAEAIGDERHRLLNEWQQAIVERLSEFEAIEQAWNFDALFACPSNGAVCLDVGRFGWPVGDHVWHVWKEDTHDLDWPESSVHLFIEIRLSDMLVIAQQSSHRPVRSSVPGQLVIDVTDSPLAAYHGNIQGRFVQRGDEWAFEPLTDRVRWSWRRPVASLRTLGQPIVPVPVQRALQAAPIDFIDLHQQRSEEPVFAQRR